MSNNKKIYFTTSIGRASYPWLNEPDTAFNQEPKYKTVLVVEDYKALVTILEDTARDEFGAKAKSASMPFEINDDTGECSFKFNSQYAPIFFDASGDEIFGSQIPKLYGGSELRLKGTVSAWSVSGRSGVSLKLSKVQIINPVGPGSDKTDGNGFGSVEGGFTADELMTETPKVNLHEVQQEAATSADRF